MAGNNAGRTPASTAPPNGKWRPCLPKRSQACCPYPWSPSATTSTGTHCASGWLRRGRSCLLRRPARLDRTSGQGAVGLPAALEMGVQEYRFVRRYLERCPQAPLSLRQVSRTRAVSRSHQQPNQGGGGMNLIELDRALKQLRLGGMAAVLETRLRQAQAEAMAPIDLLSCLVSDEYCRLSIDGGCSVARLGKVCTISQPQPIRESSLLNVRGPVILRELKLNSITDIEIGFGFKCHADLTDIQAHRANRSFTRRAMGFELQRYVASCSTFRFRTVAPAAQNGATWRSSAGSGGARSGVRDVKAGSAWSSGGTG